MSGKGMLGAPIVKKDSKISESKAARPGSGPDPELFSRDEGTRGSDEMNVEQNLEPEPKNEDQDDADDDELYASMKAGYKRSMPGTTMETGRKSEFAFEHRISSPPAIPDEEMWEEGIEDNEESGEMEELYEAGGKESPSETLQEEAEPNLQSTEEAVEEVDQLTEKEEERHMDSDDPMDVKLDEEEHVHPPATFVLEDGKVRRRKKRLVVKEEKDTKKGKEEEEESHEWVDPDYDRQDFISRPITSTPHAGIDLNVLKFYHSYGFDTHRRNNIQSLDEEHMVYIAGNYLHFYNVPSQELVLLLRSASGYGIGHVAVHPSKKYFAVGEKGDHPLVMIYTWPDLAVFRVLRKGTTKGYAYIDFNPTGELLCSQGLEPDYMLTIWDWLHEKIILRYKAFSQDVYRATFSPTNPGDLTTSGLGHIRFWKMAETFTGLKLLGQIGRFGKREISDILGYAGIADGKVVSGSEWGNMLVWDGGFIVVEITQKEGKNCHTAEITDIKHQDTEILTIGRDGYVRVWESEQLDLAALSVDEDIGKIEVEPNLEIKFNNNANLISAYRCISEDPANKTWFVQDTWGKIWVVDISAALATSEYIPNTLFFAPSGPVNGVGLSTKYTAMVIGSEGGHLWAFDYIQKNVLARKVYKAAVSKVLWFPSKYDPSGLSFLAGFNDGTVRVMVLNIVKDSSASGGDSQALEEIESGLSHEFSLIASLRFHKSRVLVLKIDEAADILYTTGGDRLIYGSKIAWDPILRKPVITPLSFVTSPFPVVSLDLHPHKNYRFIIAGRAGRVAECRRPIWESNDSVVSYDIGKLHGRRWFYKSVKSIRRREEDREKRKKEREKELDALYKSIQARREAGINVEEDLEVGRVIERYRRAQAKEDEKELYVPEKPCPVLAIYYHINSNLASPTAGQTFFMHVGEYDAGYIYECKYNRPEPGGFHKVAPTPPFTEDVGITSYLISPDNEYLIFGMSDGNIRVMGRYRPQSGDIRKEVKGKRTKSVSKIKEKNSSESSSDDADDFDTKPEEKKGKKKLLPPFPLSEYPYDLVNFWTLPMHDPDRGAVIGMAWSFDNQFLVSVGEDGAIFSYRWDPLGHLYAADEALPDPIVPTSRHEAYTIEDVENPNALTMEELRAKAEQDRLNELAEAKKEIIRSQLRTLKIDYRAIIQKNDEIPQLFRVPKAKLELDPRIKQPRQERLQNEIQEVYKRFEWDGSRSVIACDKIEKIFLDTIETHHQKVKDLEHTVEVHTFRHRLLTPEFWELYEENKIWMVREERLLSASDKGLHTAQEQSRKPALVKRFYAKDLIGDYAGKKYDIKTIHAIRQLEERLRRRYIRECEWAELDALRIADDYEAPEDVAAINYAKHHMGDFKLKSAEGYLGEKITTAERRKRIMDLKIRIYEATQEFNQHIKILEREKASVIRSSRKLEHEIRERHKSLPLEMRVNTPVVHDIEYADNPDSLFKISENSITQLQSKKLEAAGLIKRKKIAYGEELEEGVHPEEPVKKNVKIKRTIYQEGDFVRGCCDRRAPPVVLKKLEQSYAIKPAGQQIKLFTRRKELEGLSTAVFRYRKAFFTPKTEAAQRRRDRILARVAFERDYYVDNLKKLIEYFKKRVTFIRNERVELQLDVKLMGIGLLVLMQELNIVKEFDSAEKGVLERFKAQKMECDTAKKHLEKAKKHLGMAKNELRRIEIYRMKVQREVQHIINDQPRFTKYLWKVYQKPIHVPEEHDEDGSEDPSEEGSSATPSSSSSDSFGDLFKRRKAKMDIDVCPDHLDKEVYQKICDLRLKKANLDVDLEAQKSIVEKKVEDCEEARVTYEKFSGRVEGIEGEVSALRVNRQVLINRLRKVVILKADQIQCLDEEKLEMDVGPIIERIKRNFPNIEDVIVFPKDGTLKLDQRIDELKDHIMNEKKKQQRGHYVVIRLKEELHKKEKRLSTLLEKCKEDMLTRFGQIVDLEEVCACIINLEILDALIALEARRKIQCSEMDQLKRRIQQTRHQLATATIANSEYNTMLAILEERQRDVEYFLQQQSEAQDQAAAQQEEQSVNGSIMSDESSGFRSTDNEDVLEEMYTLEDRLLHQEAKLIYLREIISTCRTKGGIPPITLMTSIPDNFGSKFITLRELQDYKEYVNAEVKMLYKKNNTQQLLQSNSVMPDFNATRSEFEQVKDVPENYEGEEAQILAQLDGIAKKRESISEKVKKVMIRKEHSETDEEQEGEGRQDGETTNTVNIEVPQTREVDETEEPEGY